MKFGFLRRNVVRRAPQKFRQPVKRRRLAFDRLEDRRLLSIAPSGGQITVNDTTAGTQGGADTAMDNNGDAVVNWSSQILASNGQPTGNVNVMFKLYTHNADGTFSPLGGETRVATTNVPYDVRVARAPTSGDFVLAWVASSLNKSRNTVYKTYAEDFDAAGTSLTGGKPILVGGASDNFADGVAMNDNGFDVLYGVNTYAPYYPSNWPTVPTIERFTNSGAAVGAPVTVGNGGLIADGNGAVSMDPNGDFVVAWSNTQNRNYVVGARAYTSTGMPESPALLISYMNRILRYVTVGMDGAGDFVVSWQEQVGNGNQSLFAEQVSAHNVNGSLTYVKGSPITVATTVQYATSNPSFPMLGSYEAEDPSLAVQPNGAFAVAWNAVSQSLNGAGQISNTSTVWADTFDASGAAVEPSFPVGNSSYTVLSSMANLLPSAAVDVSGDLLIAWDGLGAGGGDTGDVYGQFYIDPPAPAATTTAPAPSSLGGVATPSGTTPAATDAVFAAYAYPEDDTMR